MNSELSRQEQSYHIDASLAWLQEAKAGEAMSFKEISELTGIRRQRIEEYYKSAIVKLQKIMAEEIKKK